MALSIISVACLFFIGHALGWFFEKTKIPDLLILMIIGYVMGPILGFISIEDFGRSGALISTVALVVILYDGGLQLTAVQLKESFFSSFILSLLSFFSIAFLAALTVMLFGGQSFAIGILCGLGVGSTSSAIVIPMVRNLNISDKTKTMLSLESAFTDVLAIVIFIVIVDGLSQGYLSAKDIFIGIGPSTIQAILLGILSGLIWAALKKWLLPVFKMVFAGEAWALLTYGLIELLGFNGAIGALALGFTLANLNLLPKWLQSQLSRTPVSSDDMSLLNELIFLLRTFFFIYLGVLVKFSNPITVFIAILVSLLIFVTRYFIIKYLMAKEPNPLDRMISFAMGPRGLACAVVATLPLQKGIAQGEFVQDTVFAIIPISILITAILVAVFENRYKSTTPPPTLAADQALIDDNHSESGSSPPASV